MAEMPSAVQAGIKATCSDMEAWSELERELQVRNRIFDKWVKDGKLAWADARDRYSRLQRACLVLKCHIEGQNQPESVETPVDSAQS